MKANKLFRMTMLIVLIVIQQIVVGQSRKCTVSFQGKNLTFEIVERKDFYSIKLVGYPQMDTIYSAVNNNALKVAIDDLIKKSSIFGKDSIKSIDELTNNLLIQLDAKQRLNELESKLEKLQNDKGAIIGYVNIKNSIVKAYLIPTKKSDNGLLSIEKLMYRKIKNVFHDTTQVNKLPFRIYNEAKGITNKCILNSLYKKSPNLLAKTPILLKIDSVDIAFECGIIKDILVRSHDTVYNKPYNFSNLRYIPSRNAQDFDRLSGKEINYLTLVYNKDSVLALDFADVINFNRKVPQASGTYVPKDTTITILNKQSIIPLHKSSVSESFDIRFYTDALGYSKTASNGLIQLEGQIDFALNQGKDKNTLYDLWRNDAHKKYREQCVWFNRISPYFRFLKLENKDNVLVLKQGDNLKDIVDVYKYANTNIGADFNIYTIRTDSKLITFNFAGGAFFTTLGDDNLIANNKDISTIYLNPNCNFKFFESNKIDFDLKAGAYLGWEVSPYEDVHFSNINAKMNDYLTNKENWMFHLQQSINLHINGDKSNSVFIRSSQYIGVKNNYFTLQIGYSTILSSLIKF